MRSRLLVAVVLLAAAFALRAEDKYYQVDLLPSGRVIATDLPVTRGTMVVFHSYPSGNLVSMRRSDVKRVVRIPSASAEASNLAESIIPIGNLAMQGGSSQAGPQNARVIGQAKAAAADKSGLGTGFYSDVIPGQTEAYGNSLNDYQVGRTYAYAPPSATQASPGAPPTAPNLTNGSNPPQ